MQTLASAPIAPTAAPATESATARQASLPVLRRLALSDEGFAFDPVTGSSFLFNDTGLMILQGCREGCSASDISRRLVDAFAVPYGDARRDVGDFLERLASLGLH